MHRRLPLCWRCCGGRDDSRQPTGEAKVSIVFDHVLPNAPGKSLKGILVEYGPGGSSAAHTHAPSAFIYATVLEGAIAGKVNDGPETIYHKGESFYEMPGDRHAVSANASATVPPSCWRYSWSIPVRRC